MSKSIIVFAKNPELGKVKTRLAATIGEKKALKAYKILLKHTEEVLIKTGIDYHPYFTKIDSAESNRYFSKVTKKEQVEGNLGAKMKAAFQEQFALGYEKVIILGTDCFELHEDHIHMAFEQLNHYDVVLGPANDGGYYLLGSNGFYPELFRSIRWSTSAVLHQTIEKTFEINKSYFFLQSLVDVDEESDLGELKYLL